MRLLALVGLVGLLSACGVGVEDESAQVPADSQEVSQQGPSERWCNSYKTQQYCPSVCAWYSYPAPGYCGLPAESIVAEQEPVQMSPPESWCRSYTTQRYCPSVCYWHSSPAPGYCSSEGEPAYQ